MTIVQAARSGFFRGGKLSSLELDEAMYTQKLIYDNCHGIFVPSAWTKSSIIEDYGQSPEKIHVVGLGANLPSVNFEEKKIFQPNIVFIGRDWHRKGGDLLIEAFRIVRRDIPEARLFIIGCSPKLQEESVSVLGHLDKKNPKDLKTLQHVLKDSSILCVPSLYEPFGICFVEAQLMGVVPVSLSGEGRSEAIIDGTSGILVSERNPGALAFAIKGLVLNQPKLQSMRIAGQRHAAENFTWSRVVEKISAVMYQ
jgi:glycosyltransferase involved in cell wall biosynthesis